MERFDFKPLAAALGPRVQMCKPVTYWSVCLSYKVSKPSALLAIIAITQCDATVRCMNLTMIYALSVWLYTLQLFPFNATMMTV